MSTHGFNSASDPSASMYIVSEKFSYIVYKAFLKYLYTGIVDLPSDEVLGEFELILSLNYRKLTTRKPIVKRNFVTELMKLADEYCETNLKRECGRIIEQAITASNVAFFYSKAIECNAKVSLSLQLIAINVGIY